MALIQKNSSLNPDVNMYHSSSYLLGNSVRVHVNPVLQDCVVGGRLVSDLELSLQNGNTDVLTALSARTPQYGSTSPRHLTASDLVSTLDNLNNRISDLEISLKSPASDAPASDAPASDAPADNS